MLLRSVAELFSREPHCCQQLLQVLMPDEIDTVIRTGLLSFVRCVPKYARFNNLAEVKQPPGLGNGIVRPFDRTASADLVLTGSRERPPCQPARQQTSKWCCQTAGLHG